MVRTRFMLSALAALAVLAASAAHAADYHQPPPPPQYIPPPPPQECCDSWYLRGFVGVGMNGKYQLDYLQNPANRQQLRFNTTSIADTIFLGGGVGYEFNNWLRFDATGRIPRQSRASMPSCIYTDRSGLPRRLTRAI